MCHATNFVKVIFPLNLLKSCDWLVIKKRYQRTLKKN